MTEAAEWDDLPREVTSYVLIKVAVRHPTGVSAESIAVALDLACELGLIENQFDDALTLSEVDAHVVDVAIAAIRVGDSENDAATDEARDD